MVDRGLGGGGLIGHRLVLVREKPRCKCQLFISLFQVSFAEGTLGGQPCTVQTFGRSQAQIAGTEVEEAPSVSTQCQGFHQRIRGQVGALQGLEPAIESNECVWLEFAVGLHNALAQKEGDHRSGGFHLREWQEVGILILQCGLNHPLDGLMR